MLVVLLVLPFTVTVFAANNVTFNVKAVKENNTPVSGAIFALECLDAGSDAVYTSSVSNNNGIATFNIPVNNGTFLLYESNFPDSYSSYDAYTIKIISGKVYISVNEEFAEYEEVTFVHHYDPSIEISVPFEFEVKQTGTKAPGKETFKVELFFDDLQKNSIIKYISNEVVTNGKGSYKSTLKFSVPASLSPVLTDGFYIKAVKSNKDGWTYSDAVYAVFCDIYKITSTFTTGNIKIHPTTPNNNTDRGFEISNNTVSEAKFINIYNKSEELNNKPSGSKTVKAEIKSPKTEDGILPALTVVTALSLNLFVALLFIKKRSSEK